MARWIALRMVPRDDRGIAMVLAIVIAAIVAGLGATVTTLSINNLQNAGRDTHAGGAFNVAEAGITRGVDYLRGSSLTALTCTDAVYAVDPAAASCSGAGAPGSRPNNPLVVTDSAGREAKVWISVQSPPDPPATGTGVYTVHSTGVSASGIGERTIEAKVQARPFRFPLAVYGDEITFGGNAGAQEVSILALDCVTQREKITFAPGLDKAYGIPTAVHTVGRSTLATNGCPAGDTRNIHTAGICNTSYAADNHVEFDQDADGGPLTGPGGAACLGAAGAYPQTSKFTIEMLREQFDYRPRGLSNAEYDALRARAQAIGQFYLDSTTWTAPDPAVYPNPVMFFDLRNSGGDVSIHDSNLPGYTDATCGTRSIVIVVLGGNLTLNGGADIVGSIFVPDGHVKANGGQQLNGTIFAKVLDKVTGGADFKLSDCFLANFPPGLRTVNPGKFREVDR